MVDAGIDLMVLTNPVSIRYATDYNGYATFQSRIPSAYLLLPVSGPVVLHGAYTRGLPTIDRCEVAHSVTAFDAGVDLRTGASRFVSDIRALMHESDLPAHGVVGVERSTPTGHETLREAGLRIVDGEPVIERARSRKVEGELAAMRRAISVAEEGIRLMRQALEPGVSENEIWSLLHRHNIASGGDWIDGRMLCSGPRTNPWYQEASHRRIDSGELVAFDTDMIGPHGYCADLSRTWVCGGGPPSAEQRDLHARAVEEIEHNTELLKPGASFLDLSHRAFRHPERFVANRYACVFHGVGMTDEYPKIAHRQDLSWTGYDGELEEGTVLSVESCVGEEGGSEGVKLEQMVQVTADGPVALSSYPLDLS